MMAMGDRWARMRSSVNMAACSREDDQNRSLAECGSLRCGVDHNLTADHHLGVSMPVLIAARGADRLVVGMRPLRCAGCRGRETENLVAAPSNGGRGNAGPWPGGWRRSFL